VTVGFHRLFTRRSFKAVRPVPRRLRSTATTTSPTNCSSGGWKGSARACRALTPSFPRRAPAGLRCPSSWCGQALRRCACPAPEAPQEKGRGARASRASRRVCAEADQPTVLSPPDSRKRDHAWRSRSSARSGGAAAGPRHRLRAADLLHRRPVRARAMP
jgi:hypothetical protein